MFSFDFMLNLPHTNVCIPIVNVLYRDICFIVVMYCKRGDNILYTFLFLFFGSKKGIRTLKY